MDPPQTKKQGHKGAKEKKFGHNNLHSGHGQRATENNQSLAKPGKAKPGKGK
jgi:hypothetical protein